MTVRTTLKYFLLALFFSLWFIFVSASFILNNLEMHKAEVNYKSPVLPYNQYEYLTTEYTDYTIDDASDYLPAFFRTDFASIPQIFWMIEAPYKANFVYASMWHDYRYSCPNGRTRKQIDDTFYSLLISEGTSTWSAMKMYLAVRLFGENYFFDGICDEIVNREIIEDKSFYEREQNNE